MYRLKRKIKNDEDKSVVFCTLATSYMMPSDVISHLV